jgi:XTP/dITP diphosphohydrolase
VTTSTTILIATKNHGKLREVRSILAGLPLAFATLDQFPDLPEPVEDADTFEGNAERKALHYARLTGLWTLADDSGLEVDALGGAPGVYSARYAGRQGDDAANNAKLIRELSKVPDEKRTARFRCAVVLASPAGVLATGCGTFEGEIVDQPKGNNGFGYDPHFFVPKLGMTAAELPPEQKNRVSHRARALGAIRPFIERLLAHSQSQVRADRNDA